MTDDWISAWQTDDYHDEVHKLLELGVIEPSKSHFCSPGILVRKSDSTYRLVMEFRALNAVTVFQAETPCNIEVELSKFAEARYFSELDLCKAYYQVQLSDRFNLLNAFATHRGLTHFVECHPVLKLPNSNRPFVVQTDASGVGLGVVLMQYYGDSAHSVAYASRKLLDRERRYSTIERECLAMVHGMAKLIFFC